jgi:hypothetical protein
MVMFCSDKKPVVLQDGKKLSDYELKDGGDNIKLIL